MYICSMHGLDRPAQGDDPSRDAERETKKTSRVRLCNENDQLSKVIFKECMRDSHEKFFDAAYAKCENSGSYFFKLTSPLEMLSAVSRKRIFPQGTGSP